MIAKSLFVLASLLLVACSDSTKQPGAPESEGGAGSSSVVNPGPGDDRLIVPEALSVSARPGINSVFSVTALTLVQGASGAELYAAVKNEGTIPACNSSFSVELFDKDDQSVAAGISGLMPQSFYQLTDGSGTVAACVAPGKLSMVAIPDLSLDIPIEDVGAVVYSSSYWVLTAAPIAGLSIEDLKPVTRSSGVAYTGNVVNELSTVLSGPSVTVFPLNNVGRPLGTASAGGSVDVAPGGSWAFETNTVSDPGVDYAAYP